MVARLTGVSMIVAVVLCVLLGAAFAEEGRGAVDAAVTVDAAGVLEENFLGVGVQWSSYPWWDLSEDDWNKVFRRVEFMTLSFTRVMLDAFWYCVGFDETGRPIYNWNTPYIKKLYRLLDWCEKNNATVVIGEWGRPAGKDLHLETDDPKWTAAVAGFVEEMLGYKEYTCIKYYNLINEPHVSGSDAFWDEWRRAIDNLHEDLTKQGLIASVKLAIPDADRDWTRRVLADENLRKRTGIYDEHLYVLASQVADGSIERYTREQVGQIQEKDPGKQYFLGEIGLVDDKKNDQQLYVYDFWYGVSMADAAIQMIRGGMSGFIAWYLDDSMHFLGDGAESMNSVSDVLPTDAYERRKIWGFWNIQGAEHGMPEDENMRPWLYAWSALSRAFPSGCQTLNTAATGVDRLRVAAARIPDGRKYHLSFAAVNNSDESKSVKIVVPKARARVNLGVYEYFDADGDNKVDAWPDVVDSDGNDIFPRVTRTLKNVDLRSGLTIEMPTRGLVVLSTLEGGGPIRLNRQSLE